MNNHTTLKLLKSAIKKLIVLDVKIAGVEINFCLLTTALKVGVSEVFLHQLSHVKPSNTSFCVHVSSMHFAAHVTSHGLD